VVSYPNICSGLTAEFLVCIARTRKFSYLVRQGESDEDSSSRVLVPVVDVNWYANVKTAMYPLSHFSKPAYLRTSQAQMIRNCILDVFAMRFQPHKEIQPLLRVAKSKSMFSSCFKAASNIVVPRRSGRVSA
jgi:hypothetical protein